MAKLKKQEMKEDKIGEAMTTALEYAKNHLEVVGGGALAVVIIILAVAMFIQNQARSEDDAVLAFDSAQGLYIQAANPQDLQKAMAQFDNVSKRYGSTSSGRQALLYLGLCYRRLAAYDKAIPCFRSFLGKGERSDLLRAAGEEALAASYEDKGDLREAGKLYTEMAGHFASDPLTASRALISAGRCYAALKDYPQARKCYQEVLEKYPVSSRNYDAKVALAMLPPQE